MRKVSPCRRSGCSPRFRCSSSCRSPAPPNAAAARDSSPCSSPRCRAPSSTRSSSGSVKRRRRSSRPGTRAASCSSAPDSRQRASPRGCAIRSSCSTIRTASPGATNDGRGTSHHHARRGGARVTSAPRVPRRAARRAARTRRVHQPSPVAAFHRWCLAGRRGRHGPFSGRRRSRCLARRPAPPWRERPRTPPRCLDVRRLGPAGHPDTGRARAGGNGWRAARLGGTLGGRRRRPVLVGAGGGRRTAARYRHAGDAGPAAARPGAARIGGRNHGDVSRVGAFPRPRAALRQRRRSGGNHRRMDGVERAGRLARQRWLRLFRRPGGAEHTVPWRGGRRRPGLSPPPSVPAERRAGRCRAPDARGRAGTVASWISLERACQDCVLAQHRRVAEGDVVIEAVLFDFNGVLVDDEPQHCAALQRVLADEGITLTREQYYAHYLGLDDRTGFVEAYRRAQRTLTTEVLKHLVEKKSKLYLELVSTSLRMVAGAPEFVRDAGRQFRLAIVSGALRREIDAVLSGTGLAGDFETIVAANDVPRSKPDPAAYLAAHDALNQRRPIALDRCVVIEDSLHGLEAARSAGMPCVMLTTSHPSQTLQGRGAALVWESLDGHRANEFAGL